MRDRVVLAGHYDSAVELHPDFEVPESQVCLPRLVVFMLLCVNPRLCCCIGGVYIKLHKLT